jgi:hypothetical protein
MIIRLNFLCRIREEAKYRSLTVGARIGAPNAKSCKLKCLWSTYLFADLRRNANRDRARRVGHLTARPRDKIPSPADLQPAQCSASAG